MLFEVLVLTLMREREAQEISYLLLEIGTVTKDCVNPRRIAVSQCEQLGLRPGFVVDLALEWSCLEHVQA